MKPKCIFCGSEELFVNKGMSTVYSDLNGTPTKAIECRNCKAGYNVEWPSEAAFREMGKMFMAVYGVPR